MPKHPLSFLAFLLIASPARPQGAAPGFEELFALAPDRRAALATLLPGTPDFYYYSCLQRQHEGDLAAVEPLLNAWIERHGRSERVTRIENRQALLSYPRDPAAARDFLVRRLRLSFDHQRQPLGESPDLPTRLDPGLISWSTLSRRALAAPGRSLAGFQDSAMRALATQELPDRSLRDLLQRLGRPDVPGLPEIVARELRLRSSKGFGALAIHERMLLAQLDELAAAMPGLLGSVQFARIYLARLAPGPDAAADDPRVRLAHLERLEAFAQRTGPAFNSLKARVLHHRLTFDLEQGRPDLERFRAYLRLPRRAPWVHPRLAEAVSANEDLVDPQAAWVSVLEPVPSEEPLVRAYLEHFLRDAASPEAFATLLQKEYLERVFAETKLLHGVGDPQRWYAMLGQPALVEELEQRVELAFAPGRPRVLGAGEPVVLDVDVKNVPTLLVKVYEIDALSYYRAAQREVDASIALDGLVANEERTFTYSEPPIRRVRRRFELPDLDRPGVFVVELIGNGTSSRAVLRKGGLRMLERAGAAGHVLTVLDETGARRPDAAVHLGTQRFEADERGEVRLPFSASPGRKTIVLEAGARASLETLQHQQETFALQAGFLINREELRPGAAARILVRPLLTVNGQRASARLLEDPVLEIESTDLMGVRANATVRGLELGDDGELVHELRVPEGLASLQLRLRGRVRDLSRGEPVDLEAAGPAGRFELNGIDATEATWAPLLGRAQGGHFLELRGKNGEPKVDQPLGLRLTHRDFTEPVEVVLKSDPSGRIHLGPLEGIVLLEPLDPPSPGWRLEEPDPWAGTALHGRAGETLRVPYAGGAREASRAVLSFLELRGDAFHRDAFEHVALSGGYVELRELPPGDYSLRLEETGAQVSVRVTDGEAREDLLVGARRVLERTPSHPLHVTALAAAGDALEVRLGGAGPSTRVHILSTRYLPAYEPLARMGAARIPPPRAAGLERPESDYASGRQLSDELRYVLDRRLARRFPGNMLRRPGLILNPWALDESIRGLELEGGAGGSFGGRRSSRAGGGPGREEVREVPGGDNGHVHASLDFLDGAGVLLPNLQPGRDGVLRVPLAELGSGRLVHVLAADAGTVVRRTIALPEAPLSTSDRRLAAALDPGRHLQEHRGIELVAAGALVPLPEGTGGGMRTYGSLAEVFTAFRALRPEVEIEPFAFLLRWPRLTPEEKRELYSQHACHELHLFLHHKDPGFFAEVVGPYLANKASKTFLDRWLLGEPLELYLEPWRFDRLNTLERILLARRTGRVAQVARQLGEALELEPPDAGEEEARFATLLLGRALGDLAFGEVPQRWVGRGPSSPGPATPGTPAETLGEGAGGVFRAAVEPQEVLEDAMDEKAGADDFYLGRGEADFARDAERRRQDRALYRNVDRTQVFAEQDWWRLPIARHDAELIEPNRFWSDFARAPEGAPFLSTHFGEATGSVAEMISALAVLDLPFEAGAPEIERTPSGPALRAATPLLLVRKEVREARPASGAAGLLVSQDFFRLDDRYRYEGSRRLDKLVRDGFLAGVAYGCRVVVTNPTSAPDEVELFLQVPEGAIPVGRNLRTRGLRVALEPYATAAHEYAFYFPLPGRFAHYPVQVTREGERVAAAEPAVLEVLARPASVDSGSWQHVSQRGTLEQVLEHLEASNPGRLALGLVAWRMRDREAYDRILAHLRDRLVYQDDLWSYGYYHGDAEAMREHLHHQEAFLEASGPWLRSPLLDIDPVELRTWQHLEFDPLVNGRAHRFGPRRTIADPAVAAQYLDLLRILAFQPRPGDREWMLVTYHLLLQDRVEEALEAFARVDPAALESRLQHAYMSAYVAFYTEDLAAARRIAEAHRDHPVTRWRALFGEVLGQLDEAEGGGRAGPADPDDLAQRQGQAAAAEPTLALAIEGRTLRLSARNLARCELRYHPMDIEFLFSTSPFVQQDAAAAVHVRPHRVDVVDLPPSGELELALPEAYRNGNVLVEARAGGLTRRKPSVASSLEVHWMERYGQVAVHEQASRRPLPKVYVKVFAREPGGRVRFHKDGYTDLRGRFDYASLSGEGADRVERFAILLHSETHGAVVAELAPPPR